METGCNPTRREALKTLSTELKAHVDATHTARTVIAKHPPDELTQHDLLQLRSGYLKQLDIQERLGIKIADLLDKILDSL